MKADRNISTGKRIGRNTYVHRSAVDALSTSQRSRIAQAAAEARRRGHRWNVAKVNDANGSVTLLDYAGFKTQTHPELRRSLQVKGGHVQAREYSRENPPILHRKGLLLKPGPLKMLADAQTEREERAGYYARGTKTIGRLRGHRERLREIRH